jgi:uncharacterized protein (DUF433 family)
MNWRERIESDPKSMHGKPHVRGTDVPVSTVLDDLVVCKDFQEVVACHPVLSEEDVRACIAWAAECSHKAEATSSSEPDVARPEAPAASATEPGPPKDFKAYLLSMPDVGDDSIFERPLEYGREVDLCDT